MKDVRPLAATEPQRVALDLQTAWGRFRYLLWKHHIVAWHALDRSLAASGLDRPGSGCESVRSQE
jgi:hypothetical protein